MPQPHRSPASTSDRRVGALAHLGIPIYGFILPLVIWSACRSKPFPRAHARQAFGFQCLFLVPYLPVVGLMVFGDLDPIAAVAALGVGLLLELPQVARALTGRPPLRIVPIDILPE